jgi:hypothetical protein
MQVDAGAIQEVGGIGPNSGSTGSVVLADNMSGASSLTADSINVNSLVIGNGATFSLAPSASDGSPMVGRSGFVVAGSLAPSSSFVAASGSLLDVGGSAGSSLAPTLGGVAGGAGVNAVPEPSTVALLLLGGLAGLSLVRRRT